MRLSEAKRDYYRRLAKEEGYASRAAYKLIEINNKYHFLRPGAVVVDFGCAPGGWLQVISENVGKNGFILGVDLKRVDIMGRRWETIVGDVEEPSVMNEIAGRLPRPADVVLSDLSPNVTGVWDLDNIRQIGLSRIVVGNLNSLLSKQGVCLLKVFQGEAFDEFVSEVRRKFSTMKIVKPTASRSESSEVYLYCTKVKDSLE